MIGLLRLEDCGGTERRKEPRAIPVQTVKNRREILTVRESVWVNHQMKWRMMLLFQLFMYQDKVDVTYFNNKAL